MVPSLCPSPRGRVHLRQDFPGDATLVIGGLHLNESGRYRCEVVDGLEDRSAAVDVELRGGASPGAFTLLGSNY